MTPASLDEGGGGGVGSKLKLQPANGDVHADKVDVHADKIFPPP